MKLPYKPTNVLHRHGGRIVEITSIKHQTGKPRDGYSTDAWYFIGQVEWADGSGKGRNDSPIDMPMLCSDTEEGAAEIRELSALMTAYLHEHGEWFDTKPHEGWYANRKERRAA